MNIQKQQGKLSEIHNRQTIGSRIAGKMISNEVQSRHRFNNKNDE